MLSLRHRLVPPTADLDVLDPAPDLDVVTKVPPAHRMRAAVSDSFGFGGEHAVLAFTSADQRRPRCPGPARRASVP